MDLEERLAAAQARFAAASKALVPKHRGGDDEVFHGHPLSGLGLDGYTAQLVKSSRWLAELEKINSVHSQYRPGGSAARRVALTAPTRRSSRTGS